MKEFTHESRCGIPYKRPQEGFVSNAIGVVKCFLVMKAILADFVAIIMVASTNTCSNTLPVFGDFTKRKPVRAGVLPTGKLSQFLSAGKHGRVPFHGEKALGSISAGFLMVLNGGYLPE